METRDKLIMILIYGFICFGIGYCEHKKTKTDCENVIVNDTTYNKVTLDSIEYNIETKDSIIVELKKKVKYEMEQAINANDSVAVEQFKELASED